MPDPFGALLPTKVESSTDDHHAPPPSTPASFAVKTLLRTRPSCVKTAPPLSPQEFFSKTQRLASP